MALVAWFLIALGLCAPLVTVYFTGAAPGAAGYASSTGYLLSLGAIILVIVVARSIARERRVRTYLIAAAVVVALNLWSSFNIAQGARIEREVASARPEINAIMQAAATETALVNSGQIPHAEVSSAWKPYVSAPAIQLGDSTLALRLRLVELMRRAKARELDLVRALRAEVEAAAIEQALTPERLVSSADRADSLARVGRYRAFMQSYAGRLANLSEQSLADIRALGLPRTSEEEMIGGRVRASRQNAATFATFIDQELQSIDSIATFIRFVDEHAAAARVQGGQLLFSDPATQAEYQAMLARTGIDPSRK